MKKEFTLLQKALGICAVIALIVATSLAWVTVQMNRMIQLETVGTAKIVDENEVSRLIAQANHHTTKMASSFKNVLLRGEGEGAADKYKKEFNKYVEQFEQTTAELLKNPAVVSDSDRVKAIHAWQSDFKAASTAYGAALNKYDPLLPFQYRDLDKSVNGIDRPVVKTGLSIEELGLQTQTSAINKLTEELHAETGRLLWTLYASMALTLTFLCASLMMYARSVRQSLGAEPGFLATQASKIASGDLQCTEMSRLKPKPGSVAAVFETMRLALLDLVCDIRERTSAAEQSLDSIRRQLGVVDESTVSQSSSSAEMAASIEEMSVNISQLFDVAEQTKLAAEDSSAESESGLSLVESTSEDVEKTAHGATELSQTVCELGSQSDQISQIISVIEEIAG